MFYPGVVEGELGGVVLQDFIQLKLSLHVPDGGDDADDVVIVHLQGYIVTEGDLILISAGVE